MDKRTGGRCLCGAVRYEITGDHHSTCHCHCRACRQTTGAAVVTWTTVAVSDCRITKGRPAMFTSTRWGVRQFCDRCGSQITFRHKDFEGDIDVAVNTLDNPDSAPPDRHIWTESRISWAQMDEHLPRSRKG